MSAGRGGVPRKDDSSRENGLLRDRLLRRNRWVLRGMEVAPEPDGLVEVPRDGMLRDGGAFWEYGASPAADTLRTACCFTGHRRLPAEEADRLRTRLEWEAAALVREGVRHFFAGGARGFDTLAAQAVLAIQEAWPSVRLTLALPCRRHTAGWNAADLRAFEETAARADEVVYVSPSYDPSCMMRRNRYLVDNSGLCVCYLTAGGGGTFRTVEYARRQGRRVINLAPAEGYEPE